jgi:hypothetical protein
LTCALGGTLAAMLLVANLCLSPLPAKRGEVAKTAFTAALH